MRVSVKVPTYSGVLCFYSLSRTDFSSPSETTHFISRDKSNSFTSYSPNCLLASLNCVHLDNLKVLYVLVLDRVTTFFNQIIMEGVSVSFSPLENEYVAHSFFRNKGQKKKVRKGAFLSFVSDSQLGLVLDFDLALNVVSLLVSSLL